MKIEKLYETYEIEKDPFYQEVEREYKNERYIEDFKSILRRVQIIDQHPIATETIMRRAFLTKFIGEGLCLDVRYASSLLLLCVPYITADALVRLDMYENPNLARTYLSYYQKSSKHTKGILKSFDTGYDRIRKVFTLTPEGRQDLLLDLPKEYQEKYLQTSDNSGSSSNVHDAFCCNFYYFLLSDSNFPFFRWYSIPFFEEEKKFGEIIENMPIIPRLTPAKKSGLRPDAFVQTLETTPKFLFVEQDLNTERASRIKDKLDNYGKLFLNQTPDERKNSTIVFSIYAESDRMKKQKGKKKGKSLTKLRKELDFLHLYLYEILPKQVTNKPITVSSARETIYDIINKFIGVKKNEYFNNFIVVQEMIEKYRDEYPNEESIDKLYEYCEDMVDAVAAETREERIMADTKIFNKRKEVLRAAAAESSLTTYFTAGVRLLVLETLNPSEFNHVLLAEHKDDVLENVLLSILEDKLELKKENRVILPEIQIESNVMLKNCCQYKEEYETYNIAIENISVDLSAWYRLKHFVEQVEHYSDTIYVVVLASNIEEIKNFNNTLYDDSTIGERYEEKKGTGVQFVYMCYDSTNFAYQEPFVIDENNVVCYL